MLAFIVSFGWFNFLGTFGNISQKQKIVKLSFYIETQTLQYTPAVNIRIRSHFEAKTRMAASITTPSSL